MDKNWMAAYVAGLHVGDPVLIRYSPWNQDRGEWDRENSVILKRVVQFRKFGRKWCMAGGRMFSYPDYDTGDGYSLVSPDDFGAMDQYHMDPLAYGLMGIPDPQALNPHWGKNDGRGIYHTSPAYRDEVSQRLGADKAALLNAFREYVRNDVRVGGIVRVVHREGTPQQKVMERKVLERSKQGWLTAGFHMFGVINDYVEGDYRLLLPGEYP